MQPGLHNESLSTKKRVQSVSGDTNLAISRLNEAIDVCYNQAYKLLYTLLTLIGYYGQLI